MNVQIGNTGSDGLFAVSRRRARARMEAMPHVTCSLYTLGQCVKRGRPKSDCGDGGGVELSAIKHAGRCKDASNIMARSLIYCLQTTL